MGAQESSRPPSPGATEWPQARWARILDRIEHRQTDIGLKFWGPPLWLEVTMTGPDSDRWPATPDDSSSWNWLSSHVCAEADRLIDNGADDNQLLLVVGRYTVENLILNAVHEIGEWFRFDGKRVFPAHVPFAEDSAASDAQGNGAVTLEVSFASPVDGPDTEPDRPMTDQLAARRRLRRLIEEVAPSRFTYVPATTVSYDGSGPVIGRHFADAPPSKFRSGWSESTLNAVDAGMAAEELIPRVKRDVHRALVAWESDRICRALHVDGRRYWRADAGRSPLGADPPDAGWDADELVSFSCAYSQ
jgi:hypothetical protein